VSSRDHLIGVVRGDSMLSSRIIIQSPVTVRTIADTDL
jgi:hypothetical protein